MFIFGAVQTISKNLELATHANTIYSSKNHQLGRRIAMSARVFVALYTATVAVLPVPAMSETVYARSQLDRIDNPAGINNPQCDPREQARNVGDRLKQAGTDAIGNAVSAIPGLGGTDPFNTKRTNQSSCKDLCVVTPVNAKFKARGSVSGTDASGPWEGDLSAGLPKEYEVAGWAAVGGPAVETTPKGDVVCYTYKNWSHTTKRSIGLEITY